ncbi:hypothetical protein BT69DRAFT_1294535 [Atractiella rhizophila]|nr:hypothetical protein BT69DRAFT_1294535 [Atractiella rhizophila]
MAVRLHATLLKLRRHSIWIPRWGSRLNLHPLVREFNLWLPLPLSLLLQHDSGSAGILSWKRREGGHWILKSVRSGSSGRTAKEVFDITAVAIPPNDLFAKQLRLDLSNLDSYGELKKAGNEDEVNFFLNKQNNPFPSTNNSAKIPPKQTLYHLFQALLPPGSQAGREEPASPTPAPARLDVEADSKSTWAAAVRDKRHPDYANNAPLLPKTPKAKRFLPDLLPSPTNYNDPTKAKKNQTSMTFKNQEFDFLDSLVNHPADLLSSPTEIGSAIKQGVDTLKGQVADLKDAVAALSLSLTLKAPLDPVAASPLNDLLEEGAIPEYTLIKEEPQKLVLIINDLFIARNIPSPVYKKTPRKEKATTSDPSQSPHVRVRAAQRLKSGDLRLHFYNAAEAQVVIETQEQWIPHLESRWSIKCKAFPAIVHAVPTFQSMMRPNCISVLAAEALLRIMMREE